MRVGNVVLFILLALTGFGFCLAYSINLSRELTDTRALLSQVQAERQALEAKYQALAEEKNRLASQVSDLSGKNVNLRQRVEDLKSERLLLTNQLDGLQKQLALVQKANPLLTWLLSLPAGHVAVAALMVPVVPLSLGAIYVMSHAKNIRFDGTQRKHGQAGLVKFHGDLTRDELHLIAQHRRAQQTRVLIK